MDPSHPTARDDRPLPRIDCPPTTLDTPEDKKTRKPRDRWLLDFLGVCSAQTCDLAKLTGVKVMLGGEGKRKG